MLTGISEGSFSRVVPLNLGSLLFNNNIGSAAVYLGEYISVYMQVYVQLYCGVSQARYTCS